MSQLALVRSARFDPAACLREVRQTLKLAVPLIGTQVAMIAMGTTDVIMAGWLGAEPLAAAGLARSFFMFVWLFSLGVLLATATLAAQAKGAGDTAGVRRTVRQGLWAAALLSVPSMLLLWQSEMIFLGLDQDPATARLGRDFIWANLPVIPFSFGFIVLRVLGATLGHNTPTLVAMVLGVACNALLNYLLMFGHGGLPALGLVGIGLATSISHVCVFAGLLAWFVLRPPFREYELLVRFWKSDWPRFREIFALGVPIGLTILSETSMFAIATVFMGWISPAALAAHAIAIQCASIAFMIPLGIGQATTVRVGWAVGAQDGEGIRRAGWTGIALGLIFGGCTALVFLTLPETLIGAFLSFEDAADREAAAIAVTLLGIAAFFQPIDGTQVTAGHALRGVSDTRVPLVFAVLGFFGLGVPSAYLLCFLADLGPAGIWYGLTLGLALAAGFTTLRFGWQAGRFARRYPPRVEPVEAGLPLASGRLGT